MQDLTTEPRNPRSPMRHTLSQPDSPMNVDLLSSIDSSYITSTHHIYHISNAIAHIPGNKTYPHPHTRTKSQRTYHHHAWHEVPCYPYDLYHISQKLIITMNVWGTVGRIPSGITPPSLHLERTELARCHMNTLFPPHSSKKYTTWKSYRLLVYHLSKLWCFS